MDDVQREFAGILADIRAHLEYRRALGMSAIEVSMIAPYGAPHGEATGSAIEMKRQVTSPFRVEGLAVVRAEIGDCTRCKLYKGRKTIVFGEGNPDAALVFVGEGPGYEEDQQGRPFVGAAGQLLTDIIVKGMKMRREDVYICNIVKCRPPNNRNPEADEIEACVPFLIKQLQAIKPKVIVALGNIAAQTLLKTKEGITRLRGNWHEYQGMPLMPTYHPAYLLRNPADKKLVWEDIKKVMSEMENPRKEGSDEGRGTRDGKNFKRPSS